jgi:hypothetical protein
MQGVSEKLNDVGAYLKDNPSVLASLLAGGGAGVLGGALTAMEKPQEGEDPSERRKRILRNALISAGGGAAAGGLGVKGYSLLSEAVPGGPPPTIGDKAQDLGLSALLTAGKSALGFGVGKGVGHVAETLDKNLMQRAIVGLKNMGEAIPKTNFGTLRRFKNLNPLEVFPKSRLLGRIGAILPLLFTAAGEKAPFAPEPGELNE